ncbi:MAG: hypothetical protein F6K31_25280 [Symploca sp. SIO2G7]|nr:hypothetical protein [Symploca sp. SIO2G7]
MLGFADGIERSHYPTSAIRIIRISRQEQNTSFQLLEASVSFCHHCIIVQEIDK